MTVPNRSAELAAFWQQWNHAQSITDEAEKHRFTAAFAAWLNDSDISGRWGRKSRAGAGQPVSKDTLGWWIAELIPAVETDGKLHAFDLISSSGAVSWDLRAEQQDPLYYNIDARWYPVSAAPPPDDTHDLEARVVTLEQAVMVLGGDLKAVKQDVAALHLDIGDLKQQIEQLRDAIAHLPPATVKLGDPVHVTGSISLGAVLRGTRVTWDGKIGPQ